MGNTTKSVILVQPTATATIPIGTHGNTMGQCGGGSSAGGQSVKSIPSGLESLVWLDNIVIKQDLELFEAICGFETNNHYVIKSPTGEDIFKVNEATSCFIRQCCGSIRPFHMYVNDLQGRQIIHLYRSLNCSTCLCPCSFQTLQVFSPPDILVGTIEQKWGIYPKFKVKDATGEVVLKIEGALCTCSCTTVDFKLLSAVDNSQVGRISKQFTGLLKELFTDSDSFGISFPVDLTVQMKATLIAACFLIVR